MSRSRRHRAPLAAALSAAVVACGAPAVAHGVPETGGASLPTLVEQSTGGEGYGAPGTRSVRVAPTALVGEVVTVRGTFPRAARQRIVLQRLDPERGWRNIARSRVHRTTRFAVDWRADRSGRVSLRVTRPRRAGAADAAPVAFVNVYRPANATFFGPGLFGNPTFCGQTLTAGLLGVAHRTLPCGTRVAVLHDRREIIVPVVDRGPFHDGYDWDLTQATADALGFTASGTIGIVRLKGG
jgi:rare lipoprotein A